MDFSLKLMASPAILIAIVVAFFGSSLVILVKKKASTLRHDEYSNKMNIKKKKKEKKKKQYPPVAGTLLQQMINFGRLYDYQTELSQKHKTFRMLMPTIRNYVYTCDPVNVEYILRTNFNNYGKGEYNSANLRELFGDGIFAVDGEKWHHQRKVASRELSTKILRDDSVDVFKTIASKLAHIIQKAASSNQVLDIQELFMRSTMESMFKVVFGAELNCLDGSDEGMRFTKAFHNSNDYTMRRYFNPLWKICRFLNIGSEAKLKESIKEVNDFVYKIIHTKMEQMSSQGNNLVKKRSTLSRFLAEREKDPETITETHLRDITLSFFVAGKDTTAGTLSWFIYMLCKHPLVQEKVALEVREETKDAENTSFDEFAKSLTDEAMGKMQYLHAVLTETLRLYPVVPLDIKVCFSDDSLPDGFAVKKGDKIFYQPYSMGRSKDLWGDDAEIFRPERWLDAEGNFQPENPFKFPVFQAGPRICLGKEFAYRQMKIFAAVLLRFFSFKLNERSEVVNYRTSINLLIDQGLHVHAFNK